MVSFISAFCIRQFNWFQLSMIYFSWWAGKKCQFLAIYFACINFSSLTGLETASSKLAHEHMGHWREIIFSKFHTFNNFYASFRKKMNWNCYLWSLTGGSHESQSCCFWVFVPLKGVRFFSRAVLKFVREGQIPSNKCVLEKSWEEF